MVMLRFMYHRLRYMSCVTTQHLRPAQKSSGGIDLLIFSDFKMCCGIILKAIISKVGGKCIPLAGLMCIYFVLHVDPRWTKSGPLGYSILKACKGFIYRCLMGKESNGGSIDILLNLMW